MSDAGPELTPDTLRALLAADLANIVALVTAGQPLSNAQRARLEEHEKKSRKAAVPEAAAPAPPPTPDLAAPPLASLDAEPESPPPVPGEYHHRQTVYADRYG